MQTHTHQIAAAVGMVLIAVPAAFAALIGSWVVQPTDATASHFEQDSRHMRWSWNGSGLNDATIVETGDPIPTTWPQHTSAGGNNGWTALNDPPGDPAQWDVWIVYDLGAEYLLGGFHVWNQNEVNQDDRSSRAVDMTFSTTSSTDGFGNMNSFEFTKAPFNDSTYEGEDYVLSTPVTARWVKLVINTNWGDETYTGLAEIRFAAIPEPASIALAALLGAGALLRRSRRAPAEV